MKIKKIAIYLFAASLGVVLGSTITGCCRNSNEVWEDSKSCGRHMSRGLRTMGGKHGDSRAVQCREDFMPIQEECYSYAGGGQPEDFVPLSDQSYEDEIAMADYISRQPRETPGDPGSSVPGIDQFQDPSSNPAWASVFRNVKFDYNSNLVKGQDNMDTIRSVSNYMRSHNNLYVFVEGHCDERGPAAFNLALGSRRANAVRNMLIDEGVNPDNIFTISYGKERPLFNDDTEDSHSQNRRAEFKLFQR
jgi:peptidoglycan-associated lipoprotein